MLKEKMSPGNAEAADSKFASPAKALITPIFRIVIIDVVLMVDVLNTGHFQKAIGVH